MLPRQTPSGTAVTSRCQIDWSCPIERQREEFDRELVDDEGSGILAWMVTGWMGYRHDGFWQPMDTLREKRLLESLWQKGQAPWKTWV